MTKANTTEVGLGYEWVKLTKQARIVYAPICHLCGKEIDLSLPARHKMSWTLDHLDPRGVVGSEVPPLERTLPAHWSCNSRRGKRVEKPVRRWNP